jgi:hypothetical protein
MTTSTFRETVALVAARAKEKLPEAVNGRIEGAVKLVLSHDVAVLEDGTIEVGSSTDALKVYHLIGVTCDCKDFTDGKAPGGWCRHRIAAGIDKRVRELLPLAPPVEPWPDNDTPPQSPPVETAALPAGVSPTATATPAPLPEAPASVNVRVTTQGREVQWTLRDSDEARLAQRLEKLLAQYPVAQAPASPAGDTTPQCPQHGAMRQGKRGWFCPTKLDDDTWCPSKAK